MIRLIIRGLVDGALSSLGVVIGASLSKDLTIILSAGLSGAVANGFSNILAAFTAEKTHQYKEFSKLEKKMLVSLKGSDTEKGIERKVLVGGVYDGVFSLLGGVLPIVPFFFFGMDIAVVISVIFVSVLAGLLGIYTSIFSKENWFVSGIKMIGFTVVTAAVCVGIQYLL